MKLPIRRARPVSGSAPFGGNHSAGRSAGVFSITSEQVEQDGLGLGHDPHHPRMPVHPLLQKCLDIGFGSRSLCRKRDQHVAIVTDVLDRSGARNIQAPTRLRDNSADQIRNQLAHQLGAAPRIIQTRITFADIGDHLGRERHDHEIIDCE